MYSFDYQRPADARPTPPRRRPRDAATWPAARRLIPAMKLRLSQPERLVDLGGIAELQRHQGRRRRASPSAR